MERARQKKSGELSAGSVLLLALGIVLVCGAALPAGYHAQRIREVRAVVREHTVYGWLLKPGFNCRHKKSGRSGSTVNYRNWNGGAIVIEDSFFCEWDKFGSSDVCVPVQPCPAVARLGGSHKAAERLAAYLRLPGWIAPHKEAAVGLLEWCGEAGRPALQEALRHRDAKVRSAAAGALGLHTGRTLRWTGETRPAPGDPLPCLVYH